MNAISLLGVLCVTLFCIDSVFGHGYMLKPVGRGSAWRKGFKTPINYNDNENFCGGLWIQTQNGGKCGICGDNYKDARPRAHENGGTYGTGVIVGQYKKGEVIDVDVELTANHLGDFQFNLCKLDGGKEEEECFKPLVYADGSKKQMVSGTVNMYKMKLQLPKDVTCKQCVLRWVYTSGNNWAPPQEQFVNCADISIV